MTLYKVDNGNMDTYALAGNRFLMSHSPRADELASSLIDLLPVGGDNLFNPYRHICAHDLPHNCAYRSR